jgi:hypothetical protein
MDGTDGLGAEILRLPVERRGRPSIEAVSALAPPRSLIDSLMAEAGLEKRDVARGFGQELAYLARAVEIGGGSDDATLRLRHLVDTHVLHAMELCQAFQASADHLIAFEVKTARADLLNGSVQKALRRARREFRDRAIAARVAADAALGAAEALAGHVRNTAGLSAADEEGPQQLHLFAAVG